jgi:branched-chain amino acid transport system substrate-binding protein
LQENVMSFCTRLIALSAALAMMPMAHAADEIVIGASLPLSGTLAGFGMYQKWGYETAVNDINKAGGLSIDGKKMPVRLVIRDDKTDPNSTAGNTETLISRDKVTAMLGSCTPALVNAGALVAERRKVPLVAGCNPIKAFTAVRKWQYAWTIFFDEADLAAAPFKMMADYNLATNKRIAVMADNGPDGRVVGGQLWPQLAKDGGYEIAQNESFPVDAQQFTSMIAQAKSANVDVVLVDAIPPQGMAIRKQMASAGLQPKLLVVEKGAEPEMFSQGLGKLANGVLVGGYWDPTFPFPGAADLAKRFEAETRQSQSQHIADSHAAAVVLLDAIARAGSLERDKINAALAKTDKQTVVGQVKFDASNVSRIAITLMQWQNGKSVVVWPASRANGKLVYPLPAAN